MFGAFLFQLVRAVIGFVVAIGLAAVILVHQWYGASSGPEGVSGLDTLSWILASLTVLPIVGAAAFLPSLALIVAAELFRWRNVLLFVAVGGGIGLLAGAAPFPAVGSYMGVDDGEIIQAAGEAPSDPDPFRFAVAGLAGGLAYWVIAGRRSGVWRDLTRPE